MTVAGLAARVGSDVEQKEQSGAVAVVTGGARGIGRACALRLAGLGARVAVLDRNLDGAAEYGERLEADSVEQELKARAGEGFGIEVDLSSQDCTADAIGQVVQRWGRLDIVVTTAGGAVTPFVRSRASETSEADLGALVDANLRTVVATCRAAVPALRDSGGGVIVTIGSGAGLISLPSGHLGMYGPVKAAVHHYTRYLANEVAQWNIRVNCVAPGAIRTARVVAESAESGFAADEQAAGIPLGRLGRPEDIADAVQFLCGPLSSYITGQLLGVNGGAQLH